MCHFGLWYRRPFATIPLVTFYLVGTPYIGWGVFVGLVLLDDLVIFHFFSMKVVNFLKNNIVNTIVRNSKNY